MAVAQEAREGDCDDKEKARNSGAKRAAQVGDAEAGIAVRDHARNRDGLQR
jgi:hypothetical protein